MKARRPDWIFDGSEIEDTFGYGQRAVDFIKRLKHPSSTHPEKNYELPFFWERIIRRIYGPCHPDGRRKVRQVFCLLPRGARKTTMGGALSLLHTFGYEKVSHGQAMVAASSEDQASTAYKEAVAIAEATPWLARHIKTTDSKFLIEHPKSRASFKALSSDGKSKLGKTPSFVLADELVAWQGQNGDELWSALRTGLNKVPNTLLMVITQAGRGRENLAWKEFDYARKVQIGDIEDSNILPVIFESDPDCDWQDEDLWHFVNPGLSLGFPDIFGLRADAQKAKDRISVRDEFRQFHLNQWLDSSASPFVDMQIYDEGRAFVDLEEKERTQEPCYLGVDLSSNSDLTAVVACWGDRERGYEVHPWFFLPEENIRRKGGQDGVSYQAWEEMGLITLTPGNVVDFRFVEDQIRELNARFKVAEMAFDPHLARNTLNNLMDDNLPAVEMRQGWITMAPAIAELERAIIGRSFRHGGNPILRWHFDNISVVVDKAGNKSFHKGRSKDRIDGAVAAAMAVARCAAGNTGLSSYATYTGSIKETMWI